jgi:predicted  nucleic acid-binding Zn-ribbon protein
MSIKIAVSLGEFIDKLTILEIKQQRITDPKKRSNVERELHSLRQSWRASEYADRAVDDLQQELRAVNEQLWDIEDQIRKKEAEADFGDEFIELARAVYQHNDRRAAVKRAINERLGSTLVEEKSYAEYRRAPQT